MAGRPRGVEDVVILRAAARVMGRLGPSGLTLAAVAREVGLVPGTLMQRFGSKRGLILALADRSVQDADTLSDRIRGEQESALAALAALLAEWMAPMVSPETFAHHLAFLCMDLTDPELHERALAVHEAQRRAVRALLAEAVSTGELRATTEVDTLTATVQAVTSGTGLSWALDRQDTLVRRVRHALDVVLAPYTATAGATTTPTT
ncbi:AcrR family transcriptional regulator [Streptomyces sp. CG 926]|uniref:TetR/AcrR family transcriptional regulator n=1 Tax=Streptomyces sp. CG 926 TaxID=1882405 RepID=UPI000D79A558|nr:TetR/AcrR family transcriptional regulator [Streptomyces sp. CG 926]PWK64762.1 AcrR family transcriptional regulator [Streptomyces sp. CG 926]